MIYTSTITSPIGYLMISSDGESITNIDFDESECTEQTSPVNQECIKQLNEYFAGERSQFDLRLNPSGTSFQKKIWRELQQIPYGETRSYKDIAQQLGDSKLIRAVGAANGKNLVAIIIPCHRVIGSQGQLVGYAGGIWRKRWLLQHEIKNNPHKQTLF